MVAHFGRAAGPSPETVCSSIAPVGSGSLNIQPMRAVRGASGGLTDRVRAEEKGQNSVSVVRETQVDFEALNRASACHNGAWP